MLFASAFQTWQIVGDGSGGREEGGGEDHGILPMSASSHKGAGVAEKISNIIRGSLKKYQPPPPQPINYEWSTYKIGTTQPASLHYKETKLKLRFSCVNGLGPLAPHCGEKKEKNQRAKRAEPPVYPLARFF